MSKDDKTVANTGKNKSVPKNLIQKEVEYTKIVTVKVVAPIEIKIIKLAASLNDENMSVASVICASNSSMPMNFLTILDLVLSNFVAQTWLPHFALESIPLCQSQ